MGKRERGRETRDRHTSTSVLLHSHVAIWPGQAQTKAVCFVWSPMWVVAEGGQALGQSLTAFYRPLAEMDRKRNS